MLYGHISNIFPYVRADLQRHTGTTWALGSSTFRCFAGGVKKASIVLFFDIVLMNEALKIGR